MIVHKTAVFQTVVIKTAVSQNGQPTVRVVQLNGFSQKNRSQNGRIPTSLCLGSMPYASGPYTVKPT
jgi:hypothetical protein